MHTMASMSNDDSNDTYTIVLRGESISITRAQIEADSPGANFFASSLLGDFMEASHRSITLDRHPGIFKIILDHLSGYTILPLDEEYVEGICGREMTTQRAMRFLSDDADYFGFTRLKEMLNEEVHRQNDEKSKQEAKEAKAVNVEKRRLELEETRLKMDLKKVVRANQRAVNERRLKLLQIELKCQLGQLQAAATFAASRQVGAASYGTKEKESIDKIRQRLRNFNGCDILGPAMRDTDQAEFDDLGISIPPMDDHDNGQTDTVAEPSTHDGDTGTLYMGDSLIDD